MGTTDRISIIIPTCDTPVFFLEKCFDAIHNQTFTDFEVLVIDASNDSETIDFIQHYLEKDNRFVMIRSQKGVSFQRNLGIDRASGNLIVFVDSDDYISNNYLQLMIAKMKETNADVVFPQLVKATYSQSQIIKTEIAETKPVYEHINDKNFFIGTEKNRLVNPVKMYSRQIIGDIRFRNDLSHGEDMMFNFDLSKKGYKAVFCEDAIYTFTAVMGNNAAIKRFSKNSIKIVKVIFKMLKRNRRNKDENFEGMYHQFCYLFSIYYSACIRLNKTLWLLWLLPCRLFYLRRHHSMKETLYLLFPYTWKLIKKIIKKG